MATEGASGEPGSGGRRDSAATAAVTGLAGEGRGGRSTQEGSLWGWDEAALGDLPPPLRPSALLLPRPVPGEKREGRGVSLPAGLPLPLSGGRRVLSPIVPSRCPGAGWACGAREGARRGVRSPVSPLSLSHPPAPPFPAACRGEGGCAPSLRAG